MGHSEEGPPGALVPVQEPPELVEVKIIGEKLKLLPAAASFEPSAEEATERIGGDRRPRPGPEPA